MRKKRNRRSLKQARRALELIFELTLDHLPNGKPVIRNVVTWIAHMGLYPETYPTAEDWGTPDD